MCESQENYEKVKAIIGEGPAIELVRAFGGTMLYLPGGITSDHPISLRIGIYNAIDLVKKLGPGVISLPAYSTHLRIERDRKIKELAKTTPQYELARIYGLTTRQIRSIVKGKPKKPKKPLKSKQRKTA